MATTHDITGGPKLIADAELLLDALDKRLLSQALRPLLDDGRSGERVLLLCTHEWGNLGDLAINYNEVAFFEKVLPELPVIPVSRGALAANWQRIRQAISPRDIIAIHGGGNMGDIWPHEEAARQAVVRAFPQNRIISMPQSIHFIDKKNEQRAFELYGKHPRFLLAVRDHPSLVTAQQYLPPDDIVQTVDIVTRHEFPFPFRQRNGTIQWLERDDAEKQVPSGMGKIRAELMVAGARLVHGDTVLPRLPFSGTELAAKLVYQKIDEIHASDLVVTDRLHAAIFALVAGTPAIVFENSYRKIRPALEKVVPNYSGRLLFASDNGSEVTTDLVAEMATMPRSTTQLRGVLAREHSAFEGRVADWLRQK